MSSPRCVTRYHPHPLVLVGAEYGGEEEEESGGWSCDAPGGSCCRGLTRRGGSSGSGSPRVSRVGIPRWRCAAGCNYDLCGPCLDRERDLSRQHATQNPVDTRRVPAHPHALARFDNGDMMWCCDTPNTTATITTTNNYNYNYSNPTTAQLPPPCRQPLCLSGLAPREACWGVPRQGVRRWRCVEGCDYDLCEPCLNALVSSGGGGGGSSSSSYSQSPDSGFAYSAQNTHGGSSHLPPVSPPPPPSQSPRLPPPHLPPPTTSNPSADPPNPWIPCTWRRTPLHSHSLGRFDDHGATDWLCNGVLPSGRRCLSGLSSSGGNSGGVALRWRCVQGCNFDLCEQCLNDSTSSASSASSASRSPPPQAFPTTAAVPVPPLSEGDVLLTTSLHPHSLQCTSDSSPWTCDIPASMGPCQCGLNSSATVPRSGIPRWRCTQGCSYSLCGACMELVRGSLVGESRRVVSLPHPLQRYHHASLRWNCDAGDLPAGCVAGLTVTSTASREGVPRWRCTQGCDYDLCQFCLDTYGSWAESQSQAQPPRAGDAENYVSDALRDVPEEFMCPITRNLMQDPVILPSGESFERVAITSWVREKGTDPLTRAPVRLEDMIPNRKLRDAIEKWKERRRQDEAKGSHTT